MRNKVSSTVFRTRQPVAGNCRFRQPVAGSTPPRQGNRAVKRLALVVSTPCEQAIWLSGMSHWGSLSKGPLWLAKLALILGEGDMYINLKAAIMARGIRQQDLALRISGSDSYISHLIAGRRRPPLHIRKRISRILNADEDWLFSTSFRVPSRRTPAKINSGLVHA